MEEPADRRVAGETDRETAAQRTNRWTDENIGGLVVISISSITSSRHSLHMYNNYVFLRCQFWVLSELLELKLHYNKI